MKRFFQSSFWTCFCLAYFVCWLLFELNRSRRRRRCKSNQRCFVAMLPDELNDADDDDDDNVIILEDSGGNVRFGHLHCPANDHVATIFHSFGQTRKKFHVKKTWVASFVGVGVAEKRKKSNLLVYYEVESLALSPLCPFLCCTHVHTHTLSLTDVHMLSHTHSLSLALSHHTRSLHRVAVRASPFRFSRNLKCIQLTKGRILNSLVPSVR